LFNNIDLVKPIITGLSQQKILARLILI